jgi:DNA-binding transcriptional ArsR family regulator
MSTGALDPLIHDPERLRIIATLAALPHGDALSVTRLQDLIGLTPDRPIAGLRELGHAGYVRTEPTGGDRAQTAVALTGEGGRHWHATSPCCGSCPGRPWKTIRHQHPTSASAMLTGTPLPRPGRALRAGQADPR